MTLRQRADLMLNTEQVGNNEWKALVRELLPYVPEEPVVVPCPSNE
jgi:hypothetical protein